MLRAGTILLVLSAIAACARAGQDGPPGLAIVPGNVESARAVGALMSEQARGKFMKLTDTDAIVDSEYVVTFAPETSPSVINEAARQLKANNIDLEFKALGNQEFGWKGLAFKVPSQAPEQTAALLESLLNMPEVESAQPNLIVKAIKAPGGGGNGGGGGGGGKKSPAPASPSPSPSPPLEPSPSPPLDSSPSPSPEPSPSPSPSPAPDVCQSFTPGTITPASTPSWGLDRLDTKARMLDRVYSYSSNGVGANVYVVDTGVQPDHPQLAGRVYTAKAVSGSAGLGGYDAFGGSGADGHGHGTHCAGTVAGVTTGVTKAAKIYAVRVLDNTGAGSSTTVINGINFVANAKSVPNRIISMSLGGGRDASINSAVAAATSAGVLSVVAAGNENMDACNTSPASAPSAITVGATDSNDVRASFSNYGSCVDIWAPGVYIYSSWIGSQYGYLDGTSMATPHVAGVAARLWAGGACSSATDCARVLTCLATPNIISGLSSLPAVSPNLLVHIPAGL